MTIAPKAEDTQQGLPDQAAWVLSLQAIALDHERVQDAATALATELATRFDCDRVSIGMVGRGYCAVVAISHGTEFESRSPVVRQIAAAMEEAVEQSVSVTVPQIEGDTPCVALASAHLARQGSAVCVVPMVTGRKAYGAITFERVGRSAFSRHEVSLCEHVASFVGPVLALKRAAQSAWSARCARALGCTRDALVGRRNWVWMLALWGLIVALGVAVTLPVPYRLSAPVRVEGAIQRALVAPADGFLQKAHVRPGDAVKAGQLLAEFADQELLLERRKWESAVAQHENAYSAALARSDRAQLMVLQAKAEEARAQLGLVERQLARARLTAPFDGIIIKGDLRQSLGAPVQRGEVLLTLAPAAAFRLILEVDERDVGRIRPGQSGTAILASMPNERWTFAVERLTPVAVVRDGRNFFEAEAKLSGVSPQLQPGLEGVAKVEMADETLAWVLTHRLFDWLRVTLWAWGL